MYNRTELVQPTTAVSLFVFLILLKKLLALILSSMSMQNVTLAKASSFHSHYRYVALVSPMPVKWISQSV